MKKNQFKTPAEFKRFVYEPGEGHFFFFCELHRNLLEREQDIAGGLFKEEKQKPPLCDWPTCKLKAAFELFPNLATALKKRYR